MKMSLMSICTSKSKQLLNFRNTLFIYFIYLTISFQLQAEFTTDFSLLFVFFVEAERLKMREKHLPFWPWDVLNHVICACSCSLTRDNDKENLRFFGRSLF